jgi:hypothetical protein
LAVISRRLDRQLTDTYDAYREQLQELTGIIERYDQIAAKIKRIQTAKKTERAITAGSDASHSIITL